MRTTSILSKIFIIGVLALFSSEIMTAQTGTVTVNQDGKIPELLDIKKSLEREGALHEEYTIQLYSGNLGQAKSVISKYRNRYGSWTAAIEYETPNYKVWAGTFSKRIEADRALLEIRNTFPNAFILKPKNNSKG